MSSLVTSINYYISFFVRWVSEPISNVTSIFFSLILISAVIGVIFAYFYGKLSSQAKIKATKKKIGASLLEAVLFRHDPVTTVKAQLGLLIGGVKYLGTTIVPILILFIPSIFLFSALQNNFGFDNLKNEEGVELVINVAKNSSLFDYAVSSNEVVQISPPLRVKDSNELIHKIAIKNDTSQELIELKTPKETFDISSLVRKDYPFLITGNLLDAFFFGALSTPPEGVSSISIDKAFKDYSFIGLDWPWYIWSIIFILIGGFLAARAFKVTF